MLVSVCFCARVNACVMTQLGGCFKVSPGIKDFGGLCRYLSDHS